MMDFIFQSITKSEKPVPIKIFVNKIEFKKIKIKTSFELCFKNFRLEKMSFRMNETITKDWIDNRIKIISEKIFSKFLFLKFYRLLVRYSNLEIFSSIGLSRHFFVPEYTCEKLRDIMKCEGVADRKYAKYAKAASIN